MIISKMTIRITNTWLGSEDIESLQEIECGFSKTQTLGKQYYVDGFFGVSQGYASLNDAMDDIARRHGFTFVEVS